jgi:hypothetical protein
MNNIADFYNIRGNNQFEKNNLLYGVESFKPYIRSPYIYIYIYIRSYNNNLNLRI